MIDKKNLEQIAIKLYPFAYCLCPDELMAGQLIVDGFTRAVLEDESFNTEHVDLRQLCQAIFSVACSRVGHLPTQNKEYANAFYSNLSLKVRAVLFLKEKWHFSITDISEMTDLAHEEVSLMLSEGRSTLLAGRERAL